MGLTFTRAVEVQPRTRPTSSQMASLALAFNDRLLSGVADCAWRVAYYLTGLWRQVRNPDASGYLFPAQHEALTHFLLADPESMLVWPIAGPGEPEGANLASPVPQFVFGVDGGVDPEAERMGEPNLPMTVDGRAPETLGDVWRLGQAQRGAYDPTTEAQAWPAGDAAQSFMQIVFPGYSPHGKSYGGFIPTPDFQEILGVPVTDCGNGDPNDWGYLIPSYLFKWTGLRADVEIPDHHGSLSYDSEGRPVITYAGSCPCESALHAAGHVVWIADLPMAWYIFVSQGAGCTLDVDRLPVNDWVPGPYTNTGVLQHTDGQHLRRVLHAFLTDFRGSEEQRQDDTFKIKSIAFDTHRIASRQYLLAPARGQLLNSETLQAIYPKAFWGPGALADGDYGQIEQSGGATEYQAADGFVIAGAFARAEGLSGPVNVEVLDGDALQGLLRLTPADGEAEALIWFSRATQARLRFRIQGEAILEAGGSLTVEAAELMDMLPEYWDLAMLCRVGAAGNNHQVDGRGLDYDSSRQLGNRYLQYGCATNENGLDGPREDGPEINRNPVFDAARRLTKSCLRIIPRQQFVGYEVADGKSILYLRRYATAIGAGPGVLDSLGGIAPPVDPVASGDLQPGETYIVRPGTGAIVYGGRFVGSGETFVADSGRSYQASGGSPAVHVYNGIRTVALKKGWTNEWCCFVEPKCANESETSALKPAAYTDFFPFVDRCHFFSGAMGLDLRKHATYNYEPSVDPDTGAVTRGNMRVQTSILAPEAPTGYRYADGSNRLTYSPERFRKSCRVYEPPLAIESATVHDWAEDQIIKLVFTGRFHSHEDAPATWSATPPMWNSADPLPATVTALVDEVAGTNGYRTIDNALREYHVRAYNPHYACRLAGAGDTGQGSYLTSSDADGACYPTIFLVSLIGRPYEDGNNTVQPHDTRMTVDQLQKCELYLRAFCEGWVDGVTSLDTICETGNGSLYDFTFEQLCFQAFSGRWIGSFGLAVRPEAPDGCGPLPMTRLHADVFNRLAKAVNMLDTARFEFPVTLEVNIRAYSGDDTVSTGPDECSLTSLFRTWADRVTAGEAPDLDYETGWYEETGVVAHWYSRLWGCPTFLQTYRQEVDWRIVPSAGWSDVLPPALLALAQGGGAGVATLTTYQRGHAARVEVASDVLSMACGDPVQCYPFTDGSKWYNWVDGNETAEWSECKLENGGTLIPQRPPVSDYALGNCGVGGGELCFGNAQAYFYASKAPLATIMPFIRVPIVDMP